MNNNLEKIVESKLRRINEVQDFIEGHVSDIKARSKHPNEVGLTPPIPNDFIIESDACAENAFDTASIMIDILSQNYGTHNIASNISALDTAIKNGEVVPFLKFNKEMSPIACAALVKINNQEVELGRAACIPGQNGGNGELMIKAFEQWKNNISFPESKILRAEVRTAKATREVPGGQATQAICLEKIGFIPTAMVPMFHHGIPDRQEIFLLASLIKENTEKKFDPEKLIPMTIGNEIERESLAIFWKKFFGVMPNFSKGTIAEIGVNNLEAKISGPIVEVRSSQSSNDVDSVVNTFFENNGRFALARISLDLPNEQVNFLCNKLRNSGFRLAGFEPIMVENKISVEILFGKLSEKGKEVMVLPSFTENVFNHKEEEILIQNSILWRQN